MFAAELSDIAHSAAESADASYALDESALEQPAYLHVTEYVSVGSHSSKPALSRFGAISALSSLRGNSTSVQDAGPSGSSKGLSSVEEIFFAGGLCLTGMLLIGVMLRLLNRARRVERHQALLNITQSEIEKERASRLSSAYNESPEDILFDGLSPLTIDFHQGLDDGKIREMMHALGPYLDDPDGGIKARAILVLGRCVALLAPEHRLDWVLAIEDFCNDAYVPAQCAAITAVGEAVPYLEPEYRHHPVMMLHMKMKTGNRKVRSAAGRALDALPSRVRQD